MSPELLTTIASVISALAFLSTSIVSILTYRKTRQVHHLTDSVRRDANDLVAKIAYLEGRQDVLITGMPELDPETRRRLLLPQQ